MLLTKYPRIWYHIQVPGGADSPASLWRDVRAVEGTGLENRRRASVRGFESHSLRHNYMMTCGSTQEAEGAPLLRE